MVLFVLFFFFLFHNIFFVTVRHKHKHKNTQQVPTLSYDLLSSITTPFPSPFFLRGWERTFCRPKKREKKRQTNKKKKHFPSGTHTRTYDGMCTPTATPPHTHAHPPIPRLRVTGLRHTTQAPRAMPGIFALLLAKGRHRRLSSSHTRTPRIAPPRLLPTAVLNLFFVLFHKAKPSPMPRPLQGLSLYPPPPLPLPSCPPAPSSKLTSFPNWKWGLRRKGGSGKVHS